MNLMRKAGLPAILVLTLLWLGCGDVFRPVANPVFKPGGDPANFHFAIVVNNNNGAFGTTTHVDLSGDTNLGNFPVGTGAVFAALNSFQTEVFTADSAGDTVSFYPPTSAAGTPARTIVLPQGSRPVFIKVASNGTAYVANSGTNSVGVISPTQLVLIGTIPVGTNPVSIAVASDNSKVYAVNQGSGTVTVISTVDNSILNPGIAVGRSPVWSVMKPDGSALYIVNQGSNSVTVINTANDTVMATLQVGSAPNFLFYDKRLNRLYVTNPGGGTVSVFDASGTGTPIAVGTVPVGHNPVSLTVLGDGSRAYVANADDNTVSVINASDLSVKTTIPVGINPVFVAASPGDTSRVVVANHGPASTATCTGGVSAAPETPECYGFISDIDTTTESVVTAAPSQAGSPGTPPPGTTLPSGSPKPVFIVTSQ